MFLVMLPSLRLVISNISIKCVTQSEQFQCLKFMLLIFFAGAVRLIFCGGIAGVSLWIAVFPADVIKSRIQILTQGSDKVPGFFETMFQIVRNEGPRALYKGLGPTLVRCFPACGALFVAYEGTQKLLENV